MEETLDINQTEKWSAFVDKLIKLTKADKVQWQDMSAHTQRKSAESPIFVATILDDKHVGIYRYGYKASFDGERSFDMSDVALELVDAGGNYLWRIPQVDNRTELMDLVEFQIADGYTTLEEFLEVE